MEIEILLSESLDVRKYGKYFISGDLSAFELLMSW